MNYRACLPLIAVFLFSILMKNLFISYEFKQSSVLTHRDTFKGVITITKNQTTKKEKASWFITKRLPTLQL